LGNGTLQNIAGTGDSTCSFDHLEVFLKVQTHFSVILHFILQALSLLHKRSRTSMTSTSLSSSDDRADFFFGAEIKDNDI
jgi:hypothetical protein